MIFGRNFDEKNDFMTTFFTNFVLEFFLQPVRAAGAHDVNDVHKSVRATTTNAEADVKSVILHETRGISAPAGRRDFNVPDASKNDADDQ